MIISFFASHGGSAVKYIAKAIFEKKLEAKLGVVIVNNPDSAIRQWCINNSISCSYISGRTHPTEDKKDEAISQTLLLANTDIIVLSGYMKKIGPITLKTFPNKILNIHPSLLPKHGGEGFYGDRVHRAVLQSGDTQSGATVHIINPEYDEGPIVSQQTIDVSEGETLDSLKLKVNALEGELYLSSIRKLLGTL